MDDQSGRILAAESALADVQRSLTAHDLLLRALLAHVALSDPAGFQGLIAGFTQSGFFGADRLTGDLTREVSDILTGMFQEVEDRVAGRR